jgi:hypothetical protein
MRSARAVANPARTSSTICSIEDPCASMIAAGAGCGRHRRRADDTHPQRGFHSSSARRFRNIHALNRTPKTLQDQSLELVVSFRLSVLRKMFPTAPVERAFFQALPKGFFNQGW